MPKEAYTSADPSPMYKGPRESTGDHNPSILVCSRTFATYFLSLPNPKKVYWWIA